MSLRPPPESLESDLSRCFDRGLRLSERRERRFFALPNFERLEVCGKHDRSEISPSNIEEFPYDEHGFLILKGGEKSKHRKIVDSLLTYSRAGRPLNHILHLPGVPKEQPRPPLAAESKIIANIALNKFSSLETLIVTLERNNQNFKHLQDLIARIFMDYAIHYKSCININDFKYMEKFIANSLTRWLRLINDEYLQGASEAEFWDALKKHDEALQKYAGLFDWQSLVEYREKRNEFMGNHIEPALNGMRLRNGVFVITYYKAYLEITKKLQELTNELNEKLKEKVENERTRNPEWNVNDLYKNILLNMTQERAESPALDGCGDKNDEESSLYNKILIILADTSKVETSRLEKVYDKFLPHRESVSSLIENVQRKLVLPAQILNMALQGAGPHGPQT